MSRYRDQVSAAVAAVTVRGRTRSAWFGRPRGGLPAALEAALDDAGRRRHLATSVTEDLYRWFYCPGDAVPARKEGALPPFEDPALCAALSAANCGRGSWEPGWTVDGRDGDRLLAVRGRLRARVRAADCRASAPGGAVLVRLPKELPAFSPGFYTAVGDAVADAGPAAPIVRVYWNVAPAGAPALTAALTRALNRAQTPFRLKVADHPLRFARSDAAVLYLGAEAFAAHRAALLGVADSVRPHLAPAVPAFTLPLAPGVALAEDRADGDESFGERRCALLAEAIVRAHEQGRRATAERLDAVAAAFAAAGVELDAPYRDPALAGRHVL